MSISCYRKHQIKFQTHLNIPLSLPDIVDIKTLSDIDHGKVDCQSAGEIKFFQSKFHIIRFLTAPLCENKHADARVSDSSATEEIPVGTALMVMVGEMKRKIEKDSSSSQLSIPVNYIKDYDTLDNFYASIKLDSKDIKVIEDAEFDTLEALHEAVNEANTAQSSLDEFPGFISAGCFKIRGASKNAATL